MLPNIKRQKVRKEFFDEEGEKFSPLKMVGTNIWPGICYLLNLLNGFQNLARNENQLIVRLKHFQLKGRKTC